MTTKGLLGPATLSGPKATVVKKYLLYVALNALPVKKEEEKEGSRKVKF